MKDRIRIIEKDLDLNNNFFINCVCKQYDTIKFIFHIFMDGEVADLTDCIFRLQAKKGDGLPYVNNKSENISVNGNIVTIDNDNQLTARAGDTVAEVVITDNEGHMKTTFDIRLNIIGSAIDGLVNSEATITILDTLEEKLNRIDNIGTVLDEASIVKNELENNTSIANKASESLNSLIPTGTTLKNTLEPLITNGTTLKTDLDTANTLAEHNIEELNKLGDVTDLAEKVETNTNLIAELNQNDTDIKATIGTETIGTTATTLKGAIKEVKGIADNNTTQLNDKVNKNAIVNNCSATEEGFALDARQGKYLNDLINRLLTLKNMDWIDQITQTGIYSISVTSANKSQFPSDNNIGDVFAIYAIQRQDNVSLLCMQLGFSRLAYNNLTISTKTLGTWKTL